MVPTMEGAKAMKTPKTYRLSQATIDFLQDLKNLDCNKYRNETDIVELAISELWMSQKLMGIDQPAKTLATRAGD